ncbi:MAG: AraC family transcriptional regulator [Treponema sp.]|jgi:AraC-like DNA-binding protein|nr:AraC family transcriptional regulator [Treponema sp.]
MKLKERGVLPESNIYFHIPKEYNRKVFLTPKSCGHYLCDSTYKVTRDKFSGYQNDTASYYGSYLCLFVKNGKGYVYQNDHRIILNKNDVFLLDCYRPHIYGTFAGSNMETLWVHFDGPMIRGCFKQIAKGTNCSVLNYLSPNRTQTIYNSLFNIYEKFDQKEGVNDILNNKYLVSVMTEFLHGNSHVQESKSNSWDDLLTYISENIQKPLKPGDLAERMALSPYHFIRQFKKKIGYTPYRYVLLAKMSAANHQLKHSSLSIKEIAINCGFSSEGSFCNAFKNLIGEWPMSYRAK